MVAPGARMFIEQFGDLFERLASYAPWAIAIELLLIWVVIYAVVRFLQGTRAAGAIRILIVSLIVFTVAMRALGAQELLPRLDYLYERTLALLAIALIVVFQPELRRAILKLGDTQLRGSGAEGVARVAHPARGRHVGSLMRSSARRPRTVDRSVGRA
ncbi:MAG: hypothetical protein AAFU70_11085, partial [Planctomycetota bacterium]